MKQAAKQTRVARIDSLTDAQKGRFDEWADKWIEVGLRTGPADRATFEAAAHKCYEHAKIPWPGRVVWVSSPLVIALAAPIASLLIQMRKRGAVRGAVGGAVRDAVGDAVGGAVDGAVRDAVRDAVGDAVGGAVGGASLRQALADVIRRGWSNYLGGQFWVGGWYWGGAVTSFFREVCDLDLPDDMWSRGIAYEQTMQSACWWYPHRDFVMACERPTVIKRELVSADRPRGWGSHRLHCTDGPAVGWSDGWGIYAVHGVRVPAYVIEHPEQISVSRIDSEQNAEVRRVMVERFGLARYMRESGADVVHELPSNYFIKGLQGAQLLRKPQPDDEDIITIAVDNSTAEPDGSIKKYLLRVDPNAYAGMASRDCHAAMASTWRLPDGALAFARPELYRPVVES